MIDPIVPREPNESWTDERETDLMASDQPLIKSGGVGFWVTSVFLLLVLYQRTLLA